MDTADGTDAFVLGKRKHRDRRQSQRKKIRKMSLQLVKTGQFPKTPCLLCGSRDGLTIHHFEPMRPDRFVFLCQECHNRAHHPLHRTISIPVLEGQFSVRPEAAIPRKEVHRD